MIYLPTGKQGQESTTVGLVDLVRFLRSGLLPAALGAAVLGAVAYAWLASRPPTYSATAVLVARADPVADSLSTASQLRMLDYETVAVSDAILLSALLGVTGEPPPDVVVEQLRRAVEVRTQDPSRSSALSIEVRNASAVGAAALANAVARALVAWDVERANQALASAVDNLSAQIRSLEAQLASLRAEPSDPSTQAALAVRETLVMEKGTQLADLASRVGEGRSSLAILQPAVAPTEPASASPAFLTAVAALLGAFLGYAVALVRDMMAPRIREPRELAQLTGAPVIAVKGRVRPLYSSSPLPAGAAGYVRALLERSERDDGPHLILAEDDAAGHLGVALALGYSIAQGGRSVAWVATGDEPIREMLGRGTQTVRPKAGSATSRLDHFALPLVALRVDSRRSFDLIGGAPHEPHAPHLTKLDLSRLLSECAEAYDVVLVTASSPATSPVPLIVAPHCANAVLVVNARRSDHGSVEELVTLLESNGVKLAAVVDTRGLSRHQLPRASASSLLRRRAASPASRDLS